MMMEAFLAPRDKAILRPFAALGLYFWAKRKKWVMSPNIAQKSSKIPLQPSGLFRNSPRAKTPVPWGKTAQNSRGTHLGYLKWAIISYQFLRDSQNAKCGGTRHPSTPPIITPPPPLTQLSGQCLPKS
jgi:hypothetical protein